MSDTKRLPVWAERLLLVVGAPLLFLGLCELTIRALGVDTDVARNDSAQIAVPVWLLADEGWVADRRSKLRRSGGEPVPAEDVAWLYHFEEARWIQYKLKPNVDVEAVNPFNEIEVARDVTFRMRSNDAGFRDDPFAPRRPGTVRIVTIGDSSTFGWGAEREDTYQALLMERLERSQPGRFEVLNLGIPGHNSRHGVGMLEHYALPLEPDLLIVAFGANDPRLVPNPTAATLDAHDTWLAGVRFALLELDTYRLLRKLVLSAVDPLSRPTEDEAQGRHKVPAVDLDAYQANLEHMLAVMQQRGGATVFVSVCTGDRRYVAGMRNVAAAAGAPFLDVRELFTAKVDALEAGELMPDLVARYRRLYGRQAMEHQRSLYVTSDGCHPHRVGNSLIAEELEGRVRAALGQPPVPSSPGEVP